MRLREQAAVNKTQEYRQQIQLMQGRQSAAHMQIHALRESRDVLGKTCGELERKLRAENEKLRKHQRRLERQHGSLLLLDYNQ